MGTEQKDPLPAWGFGPGLREAAQLRDLPKGGGLEAKAEMMLGGRFYHYSVEVNA